VGWGALRAVICCFKTAVLLNNNYIIIPCGPQYLFGPRLDCAREYGVGWGALCAVRIIIIPRRV
jgi:hypothetical protein